MALGADKSIVRVSATMDFTKREKRTENYDSQNKVVKSETIESVNTSTPGGGNAGNAAGAVANIPVGNPGGGSVEQSGGMSKSKKENIRTEYAIPSDVEQIVQRGGQILSLSVSVCLARGEKERSKDELKKIEQLIGNAVGLVKSEKRTDTIEVQEMVFPAVTAPIQSAGWQQWLPDMQLLKTIGMWAIALIVVLIVARRLTSNLDVRHEDAGVALSSVTAGRSTDDFAARSLNEGLNSTDRNMGELHAVAEQNPKAIAAWIKSVSSTGS